MDELSKSQALRIAALEAELAAARAELQDFTSTVSHDLRAPLRHIVSYIQLVQEDAGPQLSTEVQGFLHTVTGSAKQLGTMLDALLQLSRAGSVALNLQPVALRDVVQSVRSEWVERSPSRTIEWHIADDFPKVEADATLLHQAISHVMGNAIKFTAPRAIAQIEVTAQVDAAAGCVTLRLRDNGVGFPIGQQERLFKVFGRLHSAQQFEGLGMGLALTRKILARMGGAVTVNSEADAGCCVELRLRHK